MPDVCIFLLRMCSPLVNLRLHMPKFSSGIIKYCVRTKIVSLCVHSTDLTIFPVKEPECVTNHLEGLGEF